MPSPSLWLDQISAAPRRPPLRGCEEADVCIVGGGFTGLWTAYELRRAAPELKVIVLESRHVGFGASGRNGGWVLGRISGSAAAWRARGGADGPRRMLEAIQRTVHEVGSVVRLEQIDCDWHLGGSLTVAQSEVQLARLRTALRAEREWAADASDAVFLTAAELAHRVEVDHAQGALYIPSCARVQPAKLVTGLATAAERAGATVFESSPALEVVPRLVCTGGGYVKAPTVIVACEAYTAGLPGRRRKLLPLNSSMLATEPVGDSIWRSIGWEDNETLLDGAHAYTYLQRTADGRIAIGGRGVPYRFGSRTDREGPVPGRTVAELRERLLRLFPVLADVRVARAWHGVLGVSRDWCPEVSFDPASGLGYAGGYAGEGVAASNLAGRTLRDLVLGRSTELTELPWARSTARSWEPEPLRFIGARGLYATYRWADRREERRGRSSVAAALADRIAGR